MKTAMQELIEFIESTNNTPHVNLTIMDKAKKLLEKEKEQIVDFGYKCRESKNTLPQDIFNQTYTQNELPKTYINGVEVDSDNSSVTTTGVWTPKTN
jgi:hypothetical protein